MICICQQRRGKALNCRPERIEPGVKGMQLKLGSIILACAYNSLIFTNKEQIDPSPPHFEKEKEKKKSF